MADAETVPPISVVQREGGVRVVEFTQNKLLDPAELAGIEQTIGGVIDEAPYPKLVLNFQNVTNLSSAALGMLIGVRKRIRQANGMLKLANMRPELLEVFAITKLDREFDFRGGVDEAVAAMKQP